MFELPEYTTLAKQMVQTLTGKQISEGRLGNSPHKWVWYNRKPDEFAALTAGKAVGAAYCRGRWLFIPLDPGYVLTFGECGGKIQYHSSVALIPKKYHLLIFFDDATALSAVTQMWGAMALYVKGEELEQPYIKDMRATPVDDTFTYPYFEELIDERTRSGKQSVKGLLTQEQLIPGLGNAIAQDIMFNAKLYPRRPIDDLAGSEKKQLYDAIRKTVARAIELGGRNDEYNLFGQPGGYRRILDKNAAGRPCPVCGTSIVKIQYLGGACYYCPSCQV